MALVLLATVHNDFRISYDSALLVSTPRNTIQKEDLCDPSRARDPASPETKCKLIEIMSRTRSLQSVFIFIISLLF